MVLIIRMCSKEPPQDPSLFPMRQSGIVGGVPAFIFSLYVYIIGFMSFCNLTPRHPVSWSLKEDKTRRVTAVAHQSRARCPGCSHSTLSQTCSLVGCPLTRSPPVAMVSLWSWSFTATKIKLRVWRMEPGQQRPRAAELKSKPKFSGFPDLLLPLPLGGRAPGAPGSWTPASQAHGRQRPLEA